MSPKIKFLKNCNARHFLANPNKRLQKGLKMSIKAIDICPGKQMEIETVSQLLSGMILLYL